MQNMWLKLKWFIVVDVIISGVTNSGALVQQGFICVCRTTLSEGTI